MRPFAYLLTVLLLTPLAGCLGTGSSPEGTAPDAMRPAQQQALLPPEPGLTPTERYRKSLALLEVGEANRAKSELLAYLAAEPGGRFGNRSRDLLMQIDGDPEDMLGKEFFLYEMQKGDSLSTVAKQYLGDALKFYILARYNDLENPSQMKVGQTIKVPGERPADVPEIAEADPRETSEPEPDPSDEQLTTLPEPDQTPMPEDGEGEIAPPLEDMEPIEAEPEQEDLRQEEQAVEDVQTVMNKAQGMSSAGDFEGAANVYEEGLQRYPDDELIRKFAAANYITLASQATSNEQYDRAEKHLKRAKTLHPDNPEIRPMRVANYVAQADKARDEGRSDDEKKLLSAALELDRENAEVKSRLSEALVATADEAREAGRYDDERNALALASKLNPDNPEIRDRMTQFEQIGEAEAVFERGQQFEQDGKVIEADGEYQNALKKFPDHKQAQIARERIKPMVVDVYYKRGQQAFSREDLKEAIDWFNKALEVDPDHQPSKLQRNHSKELLDLLDKIPQNGN